MLTTNQVTVTTTAAVLVPANIKRDNVCITATANIYIGNSNVTATTGELVEANVPYYITAPDAIYAITATGTATASYEDNNRTDA